MECDETLVVILKSESVKSLVIIIIALGVVQLMRAKISGKKRPGSASAGIDLLDILLKPGSEHRVLEKESQQLQREEAESGAPPFSKFDVDGKSITWTKPRI
jgi:hypothetical protein